MNKKKDDNRMSVKELAEFIGVSTDAIRRAFRKGEIPAIRVRTALRFDFDEVLRYMQHNAEARYGRNPGVAGGDRRPLAGASAPGQVKRGRKFQPLD
jgi:excisionase family DNA binding protein